MPAVIHSTLCMTRRSTMVRHTKMYESPTAIENHAVADDDDDAPTLIVAMPSTVQSIASPLFSRNHSLARLKCPFRRKPRCAERGDGWADLRPRQSPQFQTRDNREYVPQYQVCRLSPRAITDAREHEKRTKKKGRTCLVDLQPLTRLLGRESPCEKDDAASGIVGTVHDGVEHRVRKGLPPLFRVRVGFVSADGEAGVEPEDAGFGEGREVAVVRACVSDVVDERAGRGRTRFGEGKSRGCRLRVVCKCS